MKSFRPFIYILAAIGLGYVFFLSFISIFPGCEISDVRIATSPSKQREAQLVVEKCPKHEPTLELQLIGKSNPSKIVSTAIATATSTDVDITWLTENRLKVSYPQSLKLSQQPSEIDGVELTFIAKPQ